MSGETEDIELAYWDRLRESDARALEWLYNRYFKVLYNYGRKILSDEKALEDGIHDLFVDLWRFRGNLSATTSIRFYLYRSLRRRIFRNEKGKNQFVDNTLLREGMLHSVPCLEDDIIEQETNDHRVAHLKKLLDDLSPRQYEAMVLRFYDEMSFEEIGGILNVNEQSARNLVQRGLTQLKQYSKLILAWAVAISFNPAGMTLW